MPLKDTNCRNAKPQDKPYRLYDEQGLYLEVQPKGGRYWRLKYRLPEDAHFTRRCSKNIEHLRIFERLRFSDRCGQLLSQAAVPDSDF
ncbi:Arm DNA-binding domain-containing protein [Pseudomonas defluvii]|nr:Arm DNA-binding domain-containing protein [Pseudomonas defluvii]